MNFSLTEEHRHIQSVCCSLALDFAKRAAAHDRDASSPVENYAALRDAGLFGLTAPKGLGGWGAGMLGYVLAAEELAQGCASTALSFNMHCVILMGLTVRSPYSAATQQHAADLAITEGKLIAALLSEPGTTNLLYSTRASTTQARRVAGGYILEGKKAFGSMVEVSDYIALFAHPAQEHNPAAGVLALFPTDTPGIRIEHVWDTLGMRGTRSDTVFFENCFVAEDAVLDEFIMPSIPEWLATEEALVNLPYTAVYLGVGIAVLKAVTTYVQNRQPRGYAQPVAYHPDVRRRVAKISAELEAARWLLRYAAWTFDTDEIGADETLAAYLKAKYVVGETVASATRSALEIGGGHAIFKGEEIERLFRDGATATIMQPSSDVCLSALSVYELQLDRDQIQSPLKLTEDG